MLDAVSIRPRRVACCYFVDCSVASSASVVLVLFPPRRARLERCARKLRDETLPNCNLVCAVVFRSFGIVGLLPCQVPECNSSVLILYGLYR